MSSATTEKPGQRRPQSQDQSRNRRTNRRIRRRRVGASIPGTKPRSPSRNLLVGAVYLLVLAVLTGILATIRVSYRPNRGC